MPPSSGDPLGGLTAAEVDPLPRSGADEEQHEAAKDAEDERALVYIDQRRVAGLGVPLYARLERAGVQVRRTSS